MLVTDRTDSITRLSFGVDATVPVNNPELEPGDPSGGSLGALRRAVIAV